MSADPTELSVENRPRRRLGTGAAHGLKRAIDVFFSLCGLVLLAPLMGMICLMILMERKGPVLYRQTRHGLNGSTFEIIKFRTLSAIDPESQFTQVQPGDQRITRIGRVLRRANLDELPQLINVLKGDMSLVGPRPHPVALDNEYRNVIPNYFDRYSVRPGITGWAQVNSFRGPTQTVGSMHARVQHDLFYIQNFSLWLDFKILFLTVFSPTAFVNAF